ncbi:MAG: methylenetetrahydrofolate reductase (NADPH) [Marivirga sp.]|jgi:methylenetetrahydrofolate reductase (NADPH)
MKVTEHIAKAKETVFSFEVLPPLKGQNIDKLFSNIEPLMEFKPPFIDVTYHREEYVYRDKGNGLLEKRTTRKRPGTVGICAAIKNRFDVDTVPHIICGGFSKEETENALIDLDFLGIDSVLILRGDPIKSEARFIPDENGHTYATELLSQVVDMNKGIYVDEELKDASPTNFCMGVAGYPEKHFEAPSMKSDIKYLKQKIALGAEYVVTQMFFDNQKYFDFVETCRKEGINVPIIPGLKPITSLKQMTALPRAFYLDLPDVLVESLEYCKDNEAAKEVGIEWCIEQSKSLIKYGVPTLHYYSMGKSDAIYAIGKAVF